ncbi:MAG: DEAD/DEAH box helicase [Chloroflexi bacterium]|nr:DEAD/DEAH box helicase [Chloroflexota bacterium]
MSEEAEPIAVPDLLASIARAMDVPAGQQIVHVETLERQAPVYASPSPPLPQALQRSLRQMGIEQLYSHQVEAIERVRRGEYVVVVTATASGKTLCYNLPIIERILADRSTRALYLYPINALINDQLKSLFRLNLGLSREAVSVARYTGALQSDQRKTVRDRNPCILLTNPEMLHLSLLLWHDRWAELWRNLRYIVIDEVHTYRGVFGSNMAQLLRRMLRMAHHYGAAPQFICCSATIANPGELAERLTGQSFSVVDRDGAGRSRRYFVLWNPPLAADAPSGLRRSHTDEAVALLQLCVQANYNTIVFARARGLTERMLRLARTSDDPDGPADAEAPDPAPISAYRAGYLAEERETIENRLKSGELQGVITTNALELGIDIGSLDAAIIAGYPGTIMSTWQQAGRAGRRGRDALIVLVASHNPLDQYYVRHPHVFFAQTHERAIIDEQNPYIRLKHLLCAARELPLAPDELRLLSTEMSETLDGLREAELLVPAIDSPGLTYPRSRRDIHFAVSLRSASHETYQILNQQRVEVGTIEPPNVYREAHPGAIYQHGEDSYRVTFLDRRRRVVRVREETLPHYTRASSATTLRIARVYASQTLATRSGPLTVALGDVVVQETVVAYQELTLSTNEMVRRVTLDQPLTLTLHTTAMWVQVPENVADLPLLPTAPPESDATPAPPLAAALHAIEHLVTGVLPLLVMCDRRDIDGYHALQHPDLGAAAAFVYDAYEGAIGLAEVAYQRAGDLLRLAYDTVTRCQCLTGCPSCIQSGVCRLRNESLDKQAAIALLGALLPSGETAADASAPSLAAGASDQDAAEQDARAPSRRRALQDLLEHTRQQTIVEHLAERDEVTPAAPERSNATSPAPAQSPAFSPGDWVEQAPYGRGQVLEVRQVGAKEIIKVRFSNRGIVRELEVGRSLVRRVRATGEATD